MRSIVLSYFRTCPTAGLACSSFIGKRSGRYIGLATYFARTWEKGDCGGESAGQGAAFAQIGDTKVAIFTVVNSVGSLLDRSGKVVRGTLNPNTGQRDRVTTIMEHFPTSASNQTTQSTGNTTLTVLVTNRKLGEHSLRHSTTSMRRRSRIASDPGFPTSRSW